MDEGVDGPFIPVRPVRLMLLLELLHGGGAERVAACLANRCDPSLIDVRVALLRPTGPYLGEIDPDKVVVGPLSRPA